MCAVGVVFAVLYELCCVSVYVVGAVCYTVCIVLWVLWAVLCDLCCVVLYCDYIKIFPIYQLSDMTERKQCHHNLGLVREDLKGKKADTAHTGIRQH